MKIVRKYNSNIVIDKSLAQTYIEKKKELEILEKEVKDMENNLKLELLPMMKELDKDKTLSNGIYASITSGYTKYSIDTPRLKNERPELYKEYLKETNVNEYVTLKVSD